MCVCLLIFVRYHLNAFCPPLPEIQCLNFLEIQNPWRKVNKVANISIICRRLLQDMSVVGRVVSSSSQVKFLEFRDYCRYKVCAPCSQQQFHKVISYLRIYSKLYFAGNFTSSWWTHGPGLCLVRVYTGGHFSVYLCIFLIFLSLQGFLIIPGR